MPLLWKLGGAALAALAVYLAVQSYNAAIDGRARAEVRAEAAEASTQVERIARGKAEKHAAEVAALATAVASLKVAVDKVKQDNRRGTDEFAALIEEVRREDPNAAAADRWPPAVVRRLCDDGLVDPAVRPALCAPPGGPVVPTGQP